LEPSPFGIAAVALLHCAPGRNFAASLLLRTEGHCLVTSGPYRWVHNPIYTSIYIILISFFLVSGNWVIGLKWLAGYMALTISSVPRDETLVEQQFGDECEAWAACTGRFVPRIRKE
jgi:protein-S-isoprenylcysteine O-methyltransferase Ste14